MTTTILTDERLIEMAANELQGHFDRLPNSIFLLFARAIEQAVLQSHEIQSAKLMAECMDMVRQELIEAGVIDATVPPMMVANTVLAEIQALRKDAERLDWLDATNAPFKMGWRFGIAPAGNVHPYTVAQIYGALTTVREGIDAAMEKQP